MIATILILYLLILIGLGFFASKQIASPTDYFVAGKNKGTLLVMGSLLSSVLGGSAILGSVNLAMHQKWASSWYLLAAAIGFLCLLPVVNRVFEHGKFTLGDLIGKFYGKTAHQLASVIIPMAWTGIVAAQVIAAAKILFTLFALSYHWGVVIAALVFIIYTLIGGQISIIKTDFMQMIILLGGIFISALMLYFNHGNAAVSALGDSFPFNPSFEFVDLLVLLLSFSSTFVVGPDVYSRIFCARNAKVAKKSVLLSAVLLIPFAFVLTYLGVFATENLNADQLHSVALIEVVKIYLPSWAVGIMAAALLSAVISSADTCLLTASIMLSELKNQNIDNRQSLKDTKKFVVLLGVVSMVIALYATSIINSLLLALAFYSGAFIVPIVLALWNVSVNKKNAPLAMLVGGVVALAGKLLSTYLNLPIGNYLLFSGFLLNFVILKWRSHAACASSEE
ncbi:MAG: sodium:solute symporter [Mangrovibacterium sp.]